MNRMRKILLTVLIFALTAACACAFTACADSDDPAKIYTVTFDTDGGTELSPIKAVGGSMIVPPADPQKSGFEFKGWYTDSEFTGDAVKVPDIMPGKNVTYYAKFEPSAGECFVEYVFNLGKYPHEGNIAAQNGNAGDKVTVKDGEDYIVAGFKFIAWSVYENGPTAFNEKLDGQYDAGDEITLAEGKITLYAQWAAEYTDARGGADKIYVNRSRIERGLGAALLVRSGQDDKLGFVQSGKNTQSGYDEFTFYVDDGGSGTYGGRLYGDFTFEVGDGVRGIYMNYDHVEREPDAGFLLAVDGFGFATLTEIRGDYTVTRASGNYEYNEKEGDYTFKFTYTDDEDKTEYISYFVLEIGTIADTQFSGYFTFQGLESASYILYENGELGYGYKLELNGYGGARMQVYDADGETVTEKYSGIYKGTLDHVDYYGEWSVTLTEETSGTQTEFMFVLGIVKPAPTATEIPVFTWFSEELFGEYKNGASVLYLDGYGSAQYTVSDTVYVGECTVGRSGLVTFVPFIENADGTLERGGTMYFNLDRAGKTFSVNSEGFAVDGDTLTGYSGTSKIVEIPDGVKTVEADAFNYISSKNTNGVSLVQVTIPSSVTAIGQRAFQNYNTLRRAVFLSDTPVVIDWSDADDPFRWGAGDFVIVVPENAKSAYIAAWPDCKYTIKGSTEITLLPEFEIENGVLLRYNKQPGAADILDITMPDEVTEIAAKVFRGLDFIRSVDLNNVTKVGEAAFENCPALETVKFTKVTELGTGAFALCEKLNNSGTETANTLDLPAVVKIGDSAFSGCISLRNVRIGADIAEIGGNAFYECNIYAKDPPLMVELLCDEAPVMGGKITVGNIGFRFKINNIDVALKCFAAPTWEDYCKHLYIESGAEKGTYVSGSDILVLDGRAVYQSSNVWMYSVEGETITLYEFDPDEEKRYGSVTGTLKDGEIKITISGKFRTFVLAGDKVTYVTSDGKYTLVCTLADLDPESYENFRGYADVMFNGKQVKLFVNGYNIKIIYGFTDSDGKKYDLALSFDDEHLVVKRTASATYINNITAPDGSVINLHFNGSLIYVFGELKIEVAPGKYLRWSEANSSIASKSGNTYTFTCLYLNKKYKITAKVSEDGKTFTYTYTVS